MNGKSKSTNSRKYTGSAKVIVWQKLYSVSHHAPTLTNTYPRTHPNGLIHACALADNRMKNKPERKDQNYAGN